ncbi:MAG TPA: SCO family protein [Gaiellaceae bacterium]|jgi:protein SCO1/2
MSRATLALVASFVVLLAAGCGSASESTPTLTDSPTKFSGGQLDPPRPTSDFTLHDQSGHEVSMAGEHGKVVLLTFLYTHCPDVCPLIAQNLVQALHSLGPAREDVRVLAVSVDPKGDTPKSVDAFAKAHHLPPQFQYLTGTRRELTRIWQAYGVQAVARSPDLVDHTAYTMLVDRSGQGRVIYDSHVKAKDVAHDVRLLLNA